MSCHLVYLYPYVNLCILLPVSATSNALATEDCRGVQFDQGQFRVLLYVSVNDLAMTH